MSKYIKIPSLQPGYCFGCIFYEDIKLYLRDTSICQKLGCIYGMIFKLQETKLNSNITIL
jgi:hypothetical protein